MWFSLQPCRLTDPTDLDVISGCLFGGNRSAGPIRHADSARRQRKLHYETNLSSIQSPACPHAWLSRPHEVARGPGRHQRAPRQGPQALGRLAPSGALSGMPKRSPGTRRLARLVTSADFERVLKARRRATTAHFAMHHLTVSAAGSPAIAENDSLTDLSTSRWVSSAAPVDDSSARGLVDDSRWLGAVVPKRHARRAVTRALLKRQIYAAAERYRARLGAGMWVVRQRAPFDRSAFPSAASEALKRCARAELESLFEASVR